MQWNTSLSPFPSEKKCQKATIRAGCNWQPQQGSEEIERRGDAVPCLLWYLLLNFPQQCLQLLGHWNSFASHTHQNPHTSVWPTRFSTETFSLFPPPPPEFYSQWSIDAGWKVTPQRYILGSLSATSDAWPHAKLMTILASSLPWQYFNIFIVFAIYQSIQFNRAQAYRVRLHLFCSRNLTSTTFTCCHLKTNTKGNPKP